MEFESDCSTMKRPFAGASSWLSEGVNVEISHHPLTMRRVVNLVIAMERLKALGSQSSLSTEFRDEDLVNILFENIVEEHVVLLMEAPDRSSNFTRRLQEPCHLTDAKKRNLVLIAETMQLHAAMLQGGQSDKKVQLTMSTYLPPASVTQTIPVALNIKGTNDYLSCTEEDGIPTLHLETYTGELRNIHKESDMVRFLFHRQVTGIDMSTFKSVRFPEWYISTTENNMPVTMCHQDTSGNKTFTVHLKNSSQ